MKVKIIGAGSIGTHMAHGCRSLGWDVAMCDIDEAALSRTREQIYPSRYGVWDDAIRLGLPTAFNKERFDVVFIGTPPDSHVPLALGELQSAHAPSILIVEKPLCQPSLAVCQQIVAAAAALGTRVLVGYNHRLTPHSKVARDLLLAQPFGRPLLLHAGFEEHWSGIFRAHPWLKGPQDTYLGYWKRGGGAGGEHSHGINIWQYFAALTGAGRIQEVFGQLEIVEQDGALFDRSMQLLVRTETGLHGSIRQDVATHPARKWCRLQGDSGFLLWEASSSPNEDSLSWTIGEDSQCQTFPKTRPDDFKGELMHLGELIADPSLDSPLSLQHGIETMLILTAGHLSSHMKKAVYIDYSAKDLEKALQVA